MGSPNLVCLVTMYTLQMSAKRKWVCCWCLCWLFPFISLYKKYIYKSVFVINLLYWDVCVLTVSWQTEARLSLWLWRVSHSRFVYMTWILFLFYCFIFLLSLFVVCWLCCKLQVHQQTVNQLWCLKLGASAPPQEPSSTLNLHLACFKLAPQQYFYHVNRDCTATSETAHVFVLSQRHSNVLGLLFDPQASECLLRVYLHGLIYTFQLENHPLSVLMKH